ncbi:hypothetical protein TanjilG_30882 [Lupinus angustifolius]|uniref:Protein CHUP1, chloroplastic n=1 Tax=Lupinus angustifolius TaxID=3871 RepID=A0A394D8N7_LUPAN|nr:PREDICTED: protein CHUP1, chloroplastic-like [Lupinus angustifolius]OIW19948.1 hypothetical protein TanjilG_30882 [Lupinus angustifolius]
MESTTSKGEIIKPIILKAGIPLAVSIAGFAYAWIMAKKSISKASSSSLNDMNSSTESEESSHSVASMDDVYADVVTESSEIHDTPCLEQEIACVRSRFERMEIRELALRFRFDEYCILKEHEFMLVDIKNMLLLESANVGFLDKEISSMERENKRLENFVLEYLKLIEQLEYWKTENKILQRKFNKLLKKSKAQSHLAKEHDLMIKADEAEIMRNLDALKNKNDVIDKLEDEIRELQRVLDLMQDEKNELLKKLDIAEKSYASKIEATDLSREDYKQVIDELEQIKKERADEVKELIFLRWTNACLKHKLTRHHEQHHNQDKEHKEHEFVGSDGVIHYDLEHELHDHDDGSLLEHDNVVHSFDDAHHHSKSDCSKRSKLLRRLKRWVEGSEKVRVRNSVS